MMEKRERFSGSGKEDKISFSEIYQKQSRRPPQAVPVFHGKKRYEEAEEEE